MLQENALMLHETCINNARHDGADVDDERTLSHETLLKLDDHEHEHDRQHTNGSSGSHIGATLIRDVDGANVVSRREDWEDGAGLGLFRTLT